MSSVNSVLTDYVGWTVVSSKRFNDLNLLEGITTKPLKRLQKNTNPTFFSVHHLALKYKRSTTLEFSQSQFTFKQIRAV